MKIDVAKNKATRFPACTGFSHLLMFKEIAYCSRRNCDFTTVLFQSLET